MNRVSQRSTKGWWQEAPSGTDTEPASYLFFGARGSGKTATLLELLYLAQADDQLAFYAQVRPHEPMNVTLYRALSKTAASPDRRSLKGPKWRKELQLGVPNLASFTVSNVSKAAETRLLSVADLLTVTATFAKSKKLEYVIIMDELHNSRPEDLTALSQALQELVEAGQYRIHFRGAALPGFRYKELSAPAQSFFKRSIKEPLPPLSERESYLGLRLYASGAGGHFSEEALRMAAASVEGSPYMLQLIGNYAWMSSNAPEAEIGVEAVQYAVDMARATYESDISSITFDELGDSEEMAVRLTYVRPEPITRNALKMQLAAAQGIKDTSAATVVARLIEAQVLSEVGGGMFVAPGSGLNADFLDERFGVTGDDAPGLPPGSSPMTAVGDSPRRALVAAGNGREVEAARCGEWMPRAHASCVLRRGHRGAHRSR